MKKPVPPAREEMESTEVLLDDMKRSISRPAMPAVTAEEEVAFTSREVRKAESVPPTREMRRAQIETWNRMAEKMIEVVVVIKETRSMFRNMGVAVGILSVINVLILAAIAIVTMNQ